MSDTKNIYQRINAVMRDVEYIKKDKKVDAPGAKYDAVTHDMVTAVIRKSLVEHGIVVQVAQTKGKMLQMRNVESGINMHLYQGDYDVDYVNIDNPSEILRVHIQAHAGDNGDKAPGKCCSYAVKHAHLKTFSLETGIDDESRVAEEDISQISQQITAADTMDDLQATFKLAWHSFPKSRAELTEIKDQRKKELVND